ncbi:MAG: hypothetical protein [Circular genetic element sp.]|nr:MAG: hypothetical protein [Circular genetic element sp.]
MGIINYDNFPNVDVFSETSQFYREWLGSEYNFSQALNRSVERTVDQYEVALILATSAAFPVVSQIRNAPALFLGRLSGAKILRTYGSHALPIPTIGGIGLGYLYNRFNESRGGRDAKPGTTVPPVGPGRRPRPPIKPSRPVSSGQTSKPFWANGKPKCKKGFRYDFKRKLCVKIK